MLIKTRAVVLHRFPYAESDIIAKMYTEKNGMVAVLVKGVRKQKPKISAACLQPLSIVETVYYHKVSREIQNIRDLKILYPFKSIPFDHSKRSLAVFLAEVLLKSIFSSEKDQALFDFIIHAIKFLDKTENHIGTFHIAFLTELSKLFGININNNYNEKNIFFNLKEGAFFPTKEQFSLPADISLQISRIFALPFSRFHEVSMVNRMRHRLLLFFLDYFDFHISGFSKINSMQVLKEVFANK